MYFEKMTSLREITTLCLPDLWVLLCIFFKWIDRQLDKGGTSMNVENRRNVQTYINLIRYPIMITEEFPSGPATTCILISD